MKNFTLSSFFAMLSLAFLISCQKEESTKKEAPAPNLPETLFDYKDLSAAPGTVFANVYDQINSEMATLGRVLFYDRHLSKNNSTSCGTCHIQRLAFADGKQFSTGLNGKQTSRNSMAIANCVSQDQFFWDIRARDLEKQVMMPIENHVEMGIENLESLPEKLAELNYYPALFNLAFGSEDITEEGISKALAMFLTSMVSKNSRFDREKFNGFSNFTSKELLGKELFEGKALCKNCHSNSILGGWGTANIGLDLTYEDQGVANGSFKIPSLKNISETAPYMHDGRFNTLEEVVNHYNEGIQNHPSLSWHLRDYNGPFRLGLTELEKIALVAFLNTLTDHQYLTDEKYSDPF